MGFAAIEVAARLQLRVERSRGWLVDWPLIETASEIMVFSSYSEAYVRRPRLQYVDVIRQAYHSLVEVVARKIGGTVDDANTIVSTAVDIRNCAVYGLQGFVSPEKSPITSEIAVVASLSKSVFADGAAA
jgi:acetamidase/formamidase